VTSATASVTVGRLPDGFLVRVQGRGTMRESPGFCRFAHDALTNGARVVVDLSECSYLDSTFLGCLVGLHKHPGAWGSRTFVVAASLPVRQKLLGPTRLDRVLLFSDESPVACGEVVPLTSQQLNPSEFGHHVMQCHERLAELGGEDSAKFEQIAKQLARELGE